MGIVGAIVIGRWAWTLMRVTAGVLLDQTDVHVAEEIRELVEKQGMPLLQTCTSGGSDRKLMRQSSAFLAKSLQTLTAYVNASNRFTKSAI